eukprot:NODE_275_length_3048_cov_67.677949_g239_i0.p1 GENE.NODE_275_length_3048_cov_67.677949_g239_i0~~NODE_275_length_3048_cov_67.677949_g239_i0.p1  ORF type:complete len:650 (+),score=114.08 NODE_275_length_3048_cov_67.677949_g239_i0:75-2024(+)
MPEQLISPDGKYVRGESIGKGSFKSVFKAMNEDEGLEVAWNEVHLKGGVQDKMRHEVQLLQQLNHPNIIKIYDYWEDIERNMLVFITELMTSGTLREFIIKQRSQTVRRKIMKNFCVQILEGLRYLHDKHIIHRDLKCDNIFLNGNRGEVKIGDFGLSINKVKTYAESVIGTPEFMAPELYEERYTEKVDIYSFGMCVLEMATGEYPYSECENVGQVFRKVTMGIKPKALEKVKEEDFASLISQCLQTEDQRPSAAQLLVQFQAMNDMPCSIERDYSLANLQASTECPFAHEEESETRCCTASPESCGLSSIPASNANTNISPTSSMASCRSRPSSTASPIDTNYPTFPVPSISPTVCQLPSKAQSIENEKPKVVRCEPKIDNHSNEKENTSESVKPNDCPPAVPRKNTIPSSVEVSRSDKETTAPNESPSSVVRPSSKSINISDKSEKNDMNTMTEKLYQKVEQEAAKTIIKAQLEANENARKEYEEQEARSNRALQSMSDKLNEKLRVYRTELETGDKEFERKKKELTQRLEYLLNEHKRLIGETNIDSKENKILGKPPPLLPLNQIINGSNGSCNGKNIQPKTPTQPVPSLNSSPIVSNDMCALGNSQRKEEVKRQALEIQSRLEVAIVDNLSSTSSFIQKGLVKI